MQGLISYLDIYFSFFFAINPELNSPNYSFVQDILIRHIIRFLCEELFEHYKQHKFSLFGALQVDKDLRLFCQYWTKKSSELDRLQEKATPIPSNQGKENMNIIKPYSIRKEETYIKLNQMEWI